MFDDNFMSMEFIILITTIISIWAWVSLSFNNIYSLFNVVIDFVCSLTIIIFAFIIVFWLNCTITLNLNIFILPLLITIFWTSAVFLHILLTRSTRLIYNNIIGLTFCVSAALLFINANSLLMMLISFEMLLFPALYMLRISSKSERINEAVLEMGLWTLIGSVCLLIAFLSTFNFNYEMFRFNSITALFLIFGFGVKIPIWPMTSWLLKAHVEASVEFSILLSGFIVKIGVVGLFKVLQLTDALFPFLFLTSISLIGLVESTLRLIGQQDFKRIVALTTIIEMNWLTFALSFQTRSSLELSCFLIVVHAFTTTSEFLIVEFITKRFNTRDITRLSGIWLITPNLWRFSIISTFITIGVPFTSIFIGKIWFFIECISWNLSCFIILLLVFMLILPIIFIRLWIVVWFGLNLNSNYNIPDLTNKEIFLLFIPIIVSVSLSCYPMLLI